MEDQHLKAHPPPLRDGACVVCWKPGENAHLIDRSLVPDPHQEPRRVVALCREHHEAYDNHRLDLLPYLEPGHRTELARAVEIFGLAGTFARVTGQAQIVLNGETVGFGMHGMAAALPKMLGVEGPE